MPSAEAQALIDRIEALQATIGCITALYSTSDEISAADREQAMLLIADLRGALKNVADGIRRGGPTVTSLEQDYYASKLYEASAQVGRIRGADDARGLLEEANRTLQKVIDQLIGR